MEYLMTLNRCSFVMIMTLNTTVVYDNYRNNREQLRLYTMETT